MRIDLGRREPKVCSWRTRVRLPAGQYRFEGQVKAEGFLPLADAPGSGICLRVFGFYGKPKPIAATSDWQSLKSDFKVTSDSADLDFICEARGYQGVVLFDEASLKIRRLIPSGQDH